MEKKGVINFINNLFLIKLFVISNIILKFSYITYFIENQSNKMYLLKIGAKIVLFLEEKGDFWKKMELVAKILFIFLTQHNCVYRRVFESYL